MPATYSPHPATRVLDYLKRMERRADEIHNRWASLHYSLVHGFVFDHVFGAIPDFNLHYPKLNIQCDPGPRKQTRGQVEMLRRPIRKIVRCVQTEERDERSRARYTLVTEILECGHKMPRRPRWFDEQPAKRRRCADCASVARGVQVEAARRAHA